MAEFDESKHPRDEDGKFTDGSGTTYRQNASYGEIPARDKRRAAYDSRDDFGRIVDRVSSVRRRKKDASKFGDDDYASDGGRRGNTDSDSSWHNDLSPRGQVDIPAGVDKVDYVADELGISKEAAERFIDAIDAYSDNKYAEIRAFQQGRHVEDAEDIARISERLEDYIKAAPRWNAGETFRGIGLSDKDLALYETGSEHDMQGVSSWSNEPAIAYQFADEYHINAAMDNAIIFHSPTQNKGTAIRHLSQYPGAGGENEVLVSKDSRYRVVGRKTDSKGRIHIYLEEI